MNLDDRMRQAFQANLDDVRSRVDIDAGAAEFQRPQPGRGRLMVSAAAVALIALGGVLVVRSFGGQGGPAVGLEAGSVEESTTVTTVATSALSVPPTETEPNELTTTTNPGSTEEEAGVTTSPTAVRAPVDGVTNAVCPTGHRAELETARLRYVGENRGWGRLDDLVDEQDGPFYFEAWEPGYPDSVTVEVSLIDPVVATDIRVAQDPFTPVDGSIFIDVDGRQISIELEGTEGWRVHQFDQPTVIDRFTIRREAVTSNIMEVLVCVVAPG